MYEYAKKKSQRRYNKFFLQDSWMMGSKMDGVMEGRDYTVYI